MELRAANVEYVVICFQICTFELLGTADDDLDDINVSCDLLSNLYL